MKEVFHSVYDRSGDVFFPVDRDGQQSASSDSTFSSIKNYMGDDRVSGKYISGKNLSAKSLNDADSHRNTDITITGTLTCNIRVYSDSKNVCGWVRLFRQATGTNRGSMNGK